MPHWYYEVFTWPRIGKGPGEVEESDVEPEPLPDTSGGRSGYRNPSEQAKQIEREREARQNENRTVVSKPKSRHKAEGWGVWDVWGSKDRIDQERFISGHDTESSAHTAGEQRARRLRVPHVHQEYPGLTNTPNDIPRERGEN